MSPKLDLVNVRVSVNGKEQTIKMERGTSFENKGGIFTAGETDGVLNMTNYQARTFLAMANNSYDDNETIKYNEILKNKSNEIDLTGAVLSKKDIEEAQKKYKNGGFVADMSEFLPEGYKIERPKLTSAENMVQAYVTNGKESQSATLKFSFDSLVNTIKPNADTNINVKEIKFVENENHELIAVDKSGKHIKNVEVYTRGEHSEFEGFSVTDKNKVQFYDTEKNLVGIIEKKDENNKIYKDANNNFLYSVTSFGNYRTEYKNKNGDKYIVDYNSETNRSDIYKYNKDGNLIKSYEQRYYAMTYPGPSIDFKFGNIERILGNEYYIFDEE